LALDDSIDFFDLAFDALAQYTQTLH
jgi:hypothetical protein